MVSAMIQSRGANEFKMLVFRLASPVKPTNSSIPRSRASTSVAARCHWAPSTYAAAAPPSATASARRLRRGSSAKSCSAPRSFWESCRVLGLGGEWPVWFDLTIHTSVHTYIHTDINIHICTYTYAYIYMCWCMCMYV